MLPHWRGEITQFPAAASQVAIAVLRRATEFFCLSSDRAQDLQEPAACNTAYSKRRGNSEFWVVASPQSSTRFPHFSSSTLESMASIVLAWSFTSVEITPCTTQRDPFQTGGRDMPEREHEGPHEIALTGDLTERESELIDKLLDVPPGGQCVLYIDSLGGSPYSAMGLTTLMLLRDIRAMGVVVGECSSAALWPFAACQRRLVTPYSVLLFHPMKWQSEENVGLHEAAEWARHFSQLESDMDRLLSELLGISLEKVHEWGRPGRYVLGPEFAQAGLAELIELKPLAALRRRSSRGNKRSQETRK